MFVGRQAEIDRIRAAAEQAYHGRPQVVFVEGPAGIGKSALVREALRPLSGWRHFSMALDEGHLHDAGSLLRHLMALRPEKVRGLTSKELVQVVVEEAESQTSPMVLKLANFDKADDASAAALLDAATAAQQGPLLAVLTARPSRRSTVARMAGFARTSSTGTFIELGP
ncbi:ATP-binding protein [Nesterenkonia flava]|uniref:AAA family ATPase n=1 Tax=Nesterenkonia flava TaxID=469799 RepID=A0ABU1FUN3_9MICC|nr:AAA family ATPase [Nesterenkonia flava]MDR5712377.1 AAA family ATPase [Nesterenkonia flava]